MSETRRNQIAKALLSIRAVIFRPDEPFTWASGIKSPVYCDNRLTLTAPDVRTQIEEGLVEVIRENYPEVEVLMGTSTAGIPHAAIVAEVLGIASIFTYGMKKGLDRMAEAHVQNVSLTDFDAMAEAAAQEGYIQPDDIRRLIAFRDNPSDESWIGGAK